MSPVASQSRCTLITRVCIASSLLGLQCGFGCGKQGWSGPHWKSSSEPSDRPVSSERRTEDAGALAATLSWARFVRFVLEERTEWCERWRFSGSEAREARCESWCSVSGMGGGSGKLAGREGAASPTSWWPVARLKVSIVCVWYIQVGAAQASGVCCAIMRLGDVV